MTHANLSFSDSARMFSHINDDTKWYMGKVYGVSTLGLVSAAVGAKFNLEASLVQFFFRTIEFTLFTITGILWIYDGFSSNCLFNGDCCNLHQER